VEFLINLLAQTGGSGLGEGMKAEIMKRRTKEYALATLRIAARLPNDKASSILAGQLMRAGTSVGANYRASCRARSRADFIAKMKIVEEECDESLYWLELLVASGQIQETACAELMSEGSQILSMIVASIKTARFSQ
jgi:four helix bundle protein